MRAKRKVAAEPKNRTLGDMRRFYRSLDLAGLWEEFYVSIDPSGRHKYKTSKQFARSQAESPKQYEFLTWLFSDDGDPELDAEFSFAKPLCFDHKRETGGWFSEKNIQESRRAIVKEINALDALRAAGNGITINSLARMEKLAQRLDEDFQGRFFVDGLTFKDNIVRARLYLGMHEKLLRMIDLAQDVYAKSHGINFQDMSGFERLLAAQALTAAAQAGGKESRAAKVLAAVAEMTLEKAVKHGFELPSDVKKVVTIESKKSTLM